MSFEDPSGTPAPVAPDRPAAGRAAAAALTDRLQGWVRWVGAGRIATGALFAVVVIGGGWWLLRTPPPPTEAQLPYASASVASDSSPSTTVTVVTSDGGPPAAIVVHVAGAVVAPGVYELPAGSRVDAAIATAGGPSRRADPGALNLAAPLVDGERIFVPRAGESPPVAADGAPSGTAAVPPGPVDVNHATLEQLDTLPGIGPATAAAIIDHREENGPFATVDDLEAVRGIGPAKLEAIRDLVTV